MQRGNMAGREWIQIKAFLSLYWEDKGDLEQNIHPFGHHDPWRVFKVGRVVIHEACCC